MYISVLLICFLNSIAVLTMACLELTAILLPLSPECHNYWHVPSCPSKLFHITTPKLNHNRNKSNTSIGSHMLCDTRNTLSSQRPSSSQVEKLCLNSDRLS